MARILLIDDEAAIRRLVRHALEADGHEVLEAGDGVSGMQIAQSEALDLVITDVLMPRQDGLETILALRRAKPGLRFIAISGGGRYAWTDVLDTATQFGADRVLAKPFEIASLRQCVREVLKSAA